MWGSDWPVLLEVGAYAAWHGATRALTQSLAQTDRDRIFGGAAASFYGILEPVR